MGKEELEALVKTLDDAARSVDKWVLVFAACVAIGVVGEAVMGIRHWLLDGRLRTARHSLDQIHEREMANRTQGIADANARAAEANLALEKLKMPRRLSPEQKKRLVGKVKAFSGQRFSLAVGQTAEQLDLLADIKEVLLSSNWAQVTPEGFGDIAIGDAALSIGTGVIIRHASSNPAPLAFDAANALAKGLNDEDIASKPESDNRITDPSILNVLVGAKPTR